MFNKFISGLSETEKKILVVTVIAVLLALFDRLLIGPSLSKLKSLDENIGKEETVIKQNLRFLTYRDRIAKEAAVFKDFYAKDVRAEEEVIGEFLKKIELMATQSQVELSKISPAGQDYQNEYIKYFVTLDCVGTLESITNFVYAINSSKDLMRVEKTNVISNAKEAAKVQASLTISRMVIGSDPSVDPKNLVRIKDESADSSSGAKK